MAHREAGPILEETTSNSPLTNTTRCCFCFPCFGSRKSSAVRLPFWQRIQSSSLGGDDHHYHDHDHHRHHQWWSAGIRALKKIREWSEIVAGPKWKTFIRRFNRNNRGGSGSGNGRHGGKFQYDPLSYALNFDEGPAGQNGDYDELDDYGSMRDFSSRFASVPSASTKDVAVMA